TSRVVRYVYLSRGTRAGTGGVKRLPPASRSIWVWRPRRDYATLLPWLRAWGCTIASSWSRGAPFLRFSAMTAPVPPSFLGTLSCAGTPDWRCLHGAVYA